MEAAIPYRTDWVIENASQEGLKIAKLPSTAFVALQTLT
jgi:hypothetical protein